ncbi:GGDEF domain-containing protein [Sulfurospirillum deleyianum]|uniref:diguanylate cyclase n=1 Tax=Sulfurospirillum deleyianum (strain ATCC 51133 / DSM 6946 / 5175) TaxID=525898 RepID=D1B2B4_SULD5|nr:GGDEF domain-containing protein [Sulfurospirillum deleyianum]ACZ12234.1 diguanylate cyclase [Sulfurospirillum deleyianum DSM 6946]
MVTLFVKMQHLVDRIVSHSPVTNKEDLARLNHYVWITFLMVPLSLGAALFNIYLEHLFLSSYLIIFCVYLIGSLFIIPSTHKVYQIYYSVILFFTILFLYLLYHSYQDRSLILWLFTYPLGIIFLLGSRTGFMFSTLFLGIILSLFIFVEHIHTLYSFSFQMRFSIIYLTISFIASWIEYHRSRYEQESFQTQEALLKEQALLKKEIQRRIVLEEELQHLAQTDILTSLFNRRHFLTLAQQEIIKALRYEHSLCFAVLDIDFFKRINDTLGHPVGDIVVSTLARHLKHSIRQSDIVARIGGEEFAFLLLHVNEEQARAKMERLRQEISECIIEYGVDKTLSVTVSIGLAMLQPPIQTLDELYMKADQKLYEAKKAGRNCIR